MRSFARTVRGGKIILSYSFFVFVFLGIVCKVCIVGYSSFKIFFVEVDMKLYIVVICVLMGMFCGSFRIVVFLFAAKIYNGSNFMFLGKMSLLNVFDVCVLSNLNLCNVVIILVIIVLCVFCNCIVSVCSAFKRVMNAFMAS